VRPGEVSVTFSPPPPPPIRPLAHQMNREEGGFLRVDQQHQHRADCQPPPNLNHCSFLSLSFFSVPCPLVTGFPLFSLSLSPFDQKIPLRAHFSPIDIYALQKKEKDGCSAGTHITQLSSTLFLLLLFFFSFYSVLLTTLILILITLTHNHQVNFLSKHIHEPHLYEKQPSIFIA
jgi:hypothetical protein